MSAVVGAVAAMGIAACGGGKSINIVQQDDGGNGTGGGGGNSAFLDCLRSNGVEVPTAFPSRFPRPSGSRRARPSGEPRPSFSRSRRPGGFASIPAACASLRPSRGFGGGPPTG